MHLGNRLKSEIEARGYQKNTVAQQLNMTENNLYKLLRKRNQDTAILEKFAELFGVELSYFFVSGELNEIDTIQKVKPDKEKKGVISKTYDALTLALQQIEELKRDKLFLQEMLAK